MPEIYPPAVFHFVLRLAGGMSDVAFQEASGLGVEMELESFREGGENRFVHQLPKGVKSPRLTLKRGVAAADSDVVKWCQEVLESDLGRRIKTQQIELNLLDCEHQPVRSWTFDNAYPVKWSVVEFRPNKNEVVLETVELAYTTVVRRL